MLPGAAATAEQVPHEREQGPRPGSRKVVQVASIRLGLFHDNAVVYK